MAATRVLNASWHEVWVETTPASGPVTIQTDIALRDATELSRMEAWLIPQGGSGSGSNPTFSLDGQRRVQVSFVLQGQLAYLLTVRYNQLDGTDANYGGFGVYVGGGGSGPAPQETEFWNEIVQPSIQGRFTYWIPVGCWFRDNPNDVQVDIYNGSVWVPQAYGADFSCKHRKTSPPTVDDLVIGVRFNNPTPGGWQIRIRWLERKILTAPWPLAKVRLTGVGGVPDYTVPWLANSITPPNAVAVPPRAGHQVEFWRLTRRSGGMTLPLPGPIPRRQGRRYVPYFRGPVDRWTFHMDELRSLVGSPSDRYLYRVCYVNPTTGARSMLSPDVVVLNLTRDERCGKIGGLRFRTAGSLWIQ